ncbi:MAG: flagellar export chaperone FlgN [Roseburia sp.]|uniref:flagellar export chaperone FlgN n=1 Tax=Roseburia sp. 831b TaxID=1261635 RepID=UPI000951D923|nr:flagellar export chaperone FlgN [Roseburia sp. 831b]MDD6217640.1 flagellar export chaperone FlgN [Roseburia sp.]WVK72810.1 flagellar export chaperone FlgN [Roseburia sp. 831b]
MSKNPYIAILIQSLRKKEQVLESISIINQRQKTELEDPSLDPDDFDKTVEEKAKLIAELEKLDDGFDEVFQKVRDDLTNHKEEYRDEIKTMQDLIRSLTAKSATVQGQEARNKVLMEQKFTAIKGQVRKVRSSQKVVNQYYQNMMKANLVDPQFTDSKK